MTSRNTKGSLSQYGATNSSSSSGAPDIKFMFNPTTFSESRSVKYHFSEGQGQVMPLSQFGMVEPTKLSFELFYFSHKGVEMQLQSLRRLVLPRKITRLAHYEQSSPHAYTLNLSKLGTWVGVVNSVDIEVKQYRKGDLAPIHFTARIDFTPTSTSIVNDVTHLKRIGGYY